MRPDPAYKKFVRLRKTNQLRISPEPPRLHREVDDARRHPAAADDKGTKRQVQPDKETDAKADERRHEIDHQALDGLLRLPEKIFAHGGDVYPHKGQEGAEIDELGAFIVMEEDRAHQGDAANQQDIVGGGRIAPVEMAKEPARDDAVAAHAEQQSRCAERPGDAGADARDQEYKGKP